MSCGRAAATLLRALGYHPLHSCQEDRQANQEGLSGGRSPCNCCYLRLQRGRGSSTGAWAPGPRGSVSARWKALREPGLGRPPSVQSPALTVSPSSPAHWGGGRIPLLPLSALQPMTDLGEGAACSADLMTNTDMGPK